LRKPVRRFQIHLLQKMLSAETSADFSRQRRLVHRIEMQARRAALEQALTQFGDDIETESANRIGVVAEALEFFAHPARDIGAAGIGEAGQLGEADDGHDAGNDRHLGAGLSGGIDKVEIGVGVVEILRDRRVGAGLDLAYEGVEVVLRAAGLGVPFRVGCYFDAEPVAGFGADEFDQFVGVAELAGFGHA